MDSEIYWYEVIFFSFHLSYIYFQSSVLQKTFPEDIENMYKLLPELKIFAEYKRKKKFIRWGEEFITLSQKELIDPSRIQTVVFFLFPSQLTNDSFRFLVLWELPLNIFVFFVNLKMTRIILIWVFSIVMSGWEHGSILFPFILNEKIPQKTTSWKH